MKKSHISATLCLLLCLTAALAAATPADQQVACYQAAATVEERCQVLNGLAHNGDPALVPFLLGLTVPEQDWKVRLFAVHALSRSRASELGGTLLDLGDREKSYRVQETCLLGLALRGERTVAPRLAEWAREKDAVLATALASRYPDGAPVVEAWPATIKVYHLLIVRALEVLFLLPDPANAQTLTGLLSSGTSPSVRAAAALALGKLPPAPEITAALRAAYLTAAATPDASPLRIATLQALRQGGDPGAEVFLLSDGILIGDRPGTTEENRRERELLSVRQAQGLAATPPEFSSRININRLWKEGEIEQLYRMWQTLPAFLRNAQLGEITRVTLGEARRMGMPPGMGAFYSLMILGEPARYHGSILERPSTACFKAFENLRPDSPDYQPMIDLLPRIILTEDVFLADRSWEWPPYEGFGRYYYNNLVPDPSFFQNSADRSLFHEMCHAWQHTHTNAWDNYLALGFDPKIRTIKQDASYGEMSRQFLGNLNEISLPLAATFAGLADTALDVPRGEEARGKFLTRLARQVESALPEGRNRSLAPEEIRPVLASLFGESALAAQEQAVADRNEVTRRKAEITQAEFKPQRTLTELYCLRLPLTTLQTLARQLWERVGEIGFPLRDNTDLHAFGDQLLVPEEIGTGQSLEIARAEYFTVSSDMYVYDRERAGRYLNDKEMAWLGQWLGQVQPAAASAAETAKE